MWIVEYKVAGFGDAPYKAGPYETYEEAEAQQADIVGFEGVHSGCITSVAPWTEAEVGALNEYQQAGYVHPFTGDRGPGGEEMVLIATSDGWVETEGGPIVQTWAHSFMVKGTWRIAWIDAAQLSAGPQE